MIRQSSHLLLTVAAVLAVVALPAPAAAQGGGTTTAAEALFAEGRALMDQRRYAEACDKFAASHDIEPSVGALLNLGDCREKNGQTASAWTGFRQAAAQARKEGDRKRARYALSRASKLEPSLSHLTIEVPDDHRVAGLRVSREGEAVPEAMWGQPVPVDPGTHEVEVTAPGHRPRRVAVEVAGGGQRASVTVPRLEPAPEPVVDGDGLGADGGAEAGGAVGIGGDVGGDAVDDGGGPGMGGRRKLALIVGAVGVAALGVGAGFGVAARGKWDQAQDGHCDADNVCDAEGVTLAGDARRLGNVANAAFAASAVAVAAGAVLWLTAPARATPDTGASRRAMVVPTVTPGAIGARVQVRF